MSKSKKMIIIIIVLILVILIGVGIYALTSYINKSNKKINELENQIIEVKKSNDLENNESLNNSREEVNIINETSNTTQNQILNTNNKTSSETTNETNKVELSEEEVLKIGKEKYSEVLTALDSIEIIEAENLGEPNSVNKESLNKARSLFTNNGFSDFIKNTGIYEKDGEYYENEMGDNPRYLYSEVKLKEYTESEMNLVIVGYYDDDSNPVNEFDYKLVKEGNTWLIDKITLPF